MSEQSTFEKVKAITVDQLSVAPEDVKMDSTSSMTWELTLWTLWN